MQKGSINRVILVGYLGSKPEFAQTPSGTNVANFSIATTESRRNSEGINEDRTEWHRCVVFGRSAEIAQNYLDKGSLIYIEGRLQTDSWEKDGIKRSSTKIIAYMFTMIGSRQNSSLNDTFNESVNEPNNTETFSNKASNTSNSNNTEDDIDLPF